MESPGSEPADAQYDTEITDLKENAKNLSECLHSLLRRIEDLERRKRGGSPRSDDDNPTLSLAVSPTSVQVQQTSSSTKDGNTTVTKRIHVTERVITSKGSFAPQMTSQMLNSDMENGDTMSEPGKQPWCVVGVPKKKTDNHLGLTVRQENGELIVARIIKDSPLAKQGLLRTGDAILEVNGVEVKSADELQAQLKAAGEGVSLKIVPSGLEGSPPPDAIYVKAFVDYDPQKDELIPCKEIGLPFQTGDILQVISKEDTNWWQARNIKQWSRIGLIPSATLEESRRAGSGKAEKKHALGGIVSIHKRRKVMYSSKQNSEFDGNDITIYEEVGKLSPFGRRCLILVGAPGVGRRTLKALILKHDPRNFATVTPYTSREPRGGEQEGREYHFVSKEKMQKDVDEGSFLEWGELNGNLYGTSLASVRQVMKSGRMCVLDLSPQAIKYLYNYEFMPYVVCVTPPPFEEMKQLYKIHPNRTKPKTEEDMRKTCIDSEEVETQCSPIFDLVLCNRNVDVTFRRLMDALESLKTDTQWVPISWLYG